MLDSLIDLQISYPFLPTAIKPDWFNAIKDIKLTVILTSSETLSEYKEINDNNIKVVLTGVNVAGLLARFEVTCRQLGIVDKEVTAPLYVWTTNCPSTGSYVIVDDINAFENVAATGLSYVVNPDVLVFMQEAPVIRYGTTALSEVISFNSGYNTNVSLSATGLTVYGAIGSGIGTYRAYPTGIDEDTFEARQNFGASSINGIQGSVWLDGTYPMMASAQVLGSTAFWHIGKD